MSNCKSTFDTQVINLLNVPELENLINNCNSCLGLPNLLPSSWRQILIINISYYIDNPTGVWADFNPVYNGWLTLVNWAREGILCFDELPPAPDPADYTDYTSPKTVNIDNVSKMKNMPDPRPYLGKPLGINL